MPLRLIQPWPLPEASEARNLLKLVLTLLQACNFWRQTQAIRPKYPEHRKQQAHTPVACNCFGIRRASCYPPDAAIRFNIDARRPGSAAARATAAINCQPLISPGIMLREQQEGFQIWGGSPTILDLQGSSICWRAVCIEASLRRC